MLPVLSKPPVAFHCMTKPIGPICNLDCRYCFYLDKQKLYPGQLQWRMAEPVLERYIQQYIQSQDVPEISFSWQGGEPTLMGLDFFAKVIQFQRQYADGKKISNAIQTNGTLLDDAWCQFLRQNQFLVGLSIDGPRQHHDRYRLDKAGRPTFDAVAAGMALLKKHAVDFNTLCVVNRVNSEHPLEVYQFLKTEGSGFIQLIPLVERLTGDGRSLAEPPLLDPAAIATEPSVQSGPASPESVQPKAWGQFLCDIFDHWVTRDVGKVFVQLFDVQLGLWMGMPSSLCVYSKDCGTAVAMEHNGDVYCCDHYVYPRYKLGNIIEVGLGEMIQSSQQAKFGHDKSATLPDACLACDVYFACNGDCPKHRFMTTASGQRGLSYLCEGYKRFFHHIDKPMTIMAQLLADRRPAADIMTLPDPRQPSGGGGQSTGKPGRNDPCPCGSGKKFKKCCGG